MGMERRRSKRATANLNADFITNGKTYAGLIENLGEDGICITTDPTDTAKDFTPGTRIELKFQIPSGEIINLSCVIIWLHTLKIQSQGLTNSMGLEIIAPPLSYKEFYKNL